MNGKELKKSINSIVLSEEAKERIIRRLEQINLNEVRETNSDEYTEYVLNVEPAKKPLLHYTMTVVSACAVLAVSVVGVCVFNRGGFGPSTEFTEQIDENKLTPEDFNSFLSEYNQEHGTQLRFPTDDECIEAGTIRSACLEFFSEFSDKESFLQYVEILAEKGETIISSFHRTNLYKDCNNDDSEVIGHYYFPYNASGQTYGISSVDGLRIVDIPDLISVVTNEGTTGYVMKAELYEESPSTPEEANKIMEERKKAIENDTYSPTILNAYDTDGKTIVGTFTIELSEPLSK